YLYLFFFSSRRRHTSSKRDWSSDVCSSDLFIYRLFPNANIIIDRFHLVQLAGRALDNCRISILKQLDKQSREYKIMKSHWKLFHKKAEDLHPEEVVFLRGVKQYMTRQNAVDLITSKFSKFAEVYQTYQDIT